MITGKSDPEQVWVAIGIKNSGMSDSGVGQRAVAALKIGTRAECEGYAVSVKRGELELPRFVFVDEIHICNLGDVDDVYGASQPESVVSLR